MGGFALAGTAIAASLPFYRQFGSVPDSIVSPNWQNAAFQNLANSYIYKDLANEKEYPQSWFKFLFAKGNRYPPRPIYSVRKNLHSLADGEFVWLGHSSLVIRLAGKFICIDPVLSQWASPIPFTIPAWPGSMPYSAADFPVIDYLCISHDHWDHLDYSAVKALNYKILICGKGVGAHFAYWGFLPKPIECDWYDEYRDNHLRIIFTPALHFSGRGMTKNRSLWGGFVLDAGSGGKIYFTGDGGFGYHFSEIGRRYGPFDIVFPDSGQYNKAWSTAHMFPEQSVQSVIDAQGALGCPLHVGKFTLSWHPWDEPVQRFSRKADEVGLPYILPVIGERYRIFDEFAGAFLRRAAIF